MSETKTHDIVKWIEPPSSSDRKETGYDEALRDSIDRGRAELDAGKGIPHDAFWAKWDREHPR